MHVGVLMLASDEFQLTFENLDLSLEFIDAALVVTQRRYVMQRWLTNHFEPLKFDLEFLDLSLHELYLRLL
jgi:hypothetical protein